MTRYTLIALALLLIGGGCAGSLKYEYAKRNHYVPCIEMDSIAITAR